MTMSSEIPSLLSFTADTAHKGKGIPSVGRLGKVYTKMVSSSALRDPICMMLRTTSENEAGLLQIRRLKREKKSEGWMLKPRKLHHCQQNPIPGDVVLSTWFTFLLGRV